MSRNGKTFTRVTLKVKYLFTIMRVVVTLSTIPSREKSVIDAVLSIKKGTVVPDAVYVNLPIWYPNFNKAPDPALKKRLEDVGAIVNVCEDYGTFTKFIPTLEVEKDLDTLIIIIDDDNVYSPNFVAGLVKGYEDFRCPVGYSGLCYPETVIQLFGVLKYHLFIGHGVSAEMLECVFGYAFTVADIQGFPAIKPMNMDKKFFYFSDDYVLSRFFKEKKVVMYDVIGRVGDDCSSICTQNTCLPEDYFRLSKNENNLLNFFKAGQLLCGHQTF